MTSSFIPYCGTPPFPRCTDVEFRSDPISALNRHIGTIFFGRAQEDSATQPTLLWVRMACRSDRIDFAALQSECSLVLGSSRPAHGFDANCGTFDRARVRKESGDSSTKSSKIELDHD